MWGRNTESAVASRSIHAVKILPDPSGCLLGIRPQETKLSHAQPLLWRNRFLAAGMETSTRAWGRRIRGCPEASGEAGGPSWDVQGGTPQGCEAELSWVRRMRRKRKRKENKMELGREQRNASGGESNVSKDRRQRGPLPLWEVEEGQWAFFEPMCCPREAELCPKTPETCWMTFWQRQNLIRCMFLKGWCEQPAAQHQGERLQDHSGQLGCPGEGTDSIGGMQAHQVGGCMWEGGRRAPGQSRMIMMGTCRLRCTH